MGSRKSWGEPEGVMVAAEGTAVLTPLKGVLCGEVPGSAKCRCSFWNDKQRGETLGQVCGHSAGAIKGTDDGVDHAGKDFESREGGLES